MEFHSIDIGLSSGLQEAMIRLYHRSVQTLSSELRPNLPLSDARHELELEDGDPRVLKYIDKRDPGNPKSCEERKGVHHLVHGWQQQGHPEKVCLNNTIASC